MKSRDVPVDLIKDLISYDPETGILMWLPRSERHYADRVRKRSAQNLANNFNARFAGKKVGSVNCDGYITTRVLGVSLLGHRIAFALMNNAWPEHEIDHINGNGADNRLVNLRDVDHSENGKNQRRPGSKTSGVVGVDYHKKDRRWRARITSKGRVMLIGAFDTLEEAIAARKAAEREHGFHPNHGRVAA